MCKHAVTLILITLFSIALAACGGSGGGSGGGNNNGGGGGGGGDGDGGGATTYHFEFLPGTTFSQEQVVNMGAEGYIFLGPVILGSVEEQQGLLFGRFRDATYEYQTPAQQPTLAEFKAGANAEGQAGFALNTPYIDLYGDEVIRTVYIHQQGTNTTYETELTPGMATGADGFIELANQMGANGYLFVGPVADSTGSAAYLWKRTIDGSAKYTYTTTPFDALTETEAAFHAAVTEQGNQGYLWLYPFAFINESGDAEYANIYIKDTNSSARFDYELMAIPDTASEVVEQANQKGTQGTFFFGFVTFASNDPVNDPAGERLLFVTPENCSDSPLCTFLPGVF